MTITLKFKVYLFYNVY